MKYLLQIWGDEREFFGSAPEAIVKMVDEYRAVTEEMQTAGVFLHGEGLQPTATATSVQVRDGETTVTDGPFAETKEQLGGFFLIECADLDRALEWAARLPGSRVGTIEVRPVSEYEQQQS
jgi:hypothetical protein